MNSILRTTVRKNSELKGLILAGTVIFLVTAAGFAYAQTKTTTKKPAGAGTTAKPPSASQKSVPPTAPPAPAISSPEDLAISQMSFLSGKWEGTVDAFPFKMDIAILGFMADPGPGINFKIHATPTSTATMGIEGDYKSTVKYSSKHSALRAVVVDAEGRGVEMIGKKVAGQPEWQFDSTPDGAPFPFKVRLIPLSTDQIVVNYTTGGRLPLKYEVTFNRVDS